MSLEIGFLNFCCVLDSLSMTTPNTLLEGSRYPARVFMERLDTILQEQNHVPNTWKKNRHWPAPILSSSACLANHGSKRCSSSCHKQTPGKRLRCKGNQNIVLSLRHFGAYQVAQMVKNLPAMQETWFNPWVRKVPWRRRWQPTSVFLPGEFHGQRSLAGYRPWGRKESDKTEWLTHTYSWITLGKKQTGRECNPTHQRIIGLKLYWARPCPPEQELVFPTTSPSHKEVYTSLLASSIRGQTEVRTTVPQQLKQKPYYRKLCLRWRDKIKSKKNN